MRVSFLTMMMMTMTMMCYVVPYKYVHVFLVSIRAGVPHSLS